MATKKTTVEVEVKDNGSTAKLEQQAKKLNQSLKEAARTASSIGTGGTAGSRRLAYSAQQRNAASVMTETEYNAARGAAGVTRAAARDFATQAQGLGGLVRLYATYAANIYAVGAAFRALSSAMDTSNMVRGLNQLGAASGVAMGSLSKQLVVATDGAISMREAMESVAKASSSGMSSKNILRMGEAAKKASQALGIDMADAMSRITRASTKLEPELVDELGLFTRTGKAAEEYAKSVGKSVSQLSDFERRMSYSNALLAESERKFGEIEIDTNPYTKLAAAVKDVTQNGLELVNKVLIPVISYLNMNPTALGLALAAIGGILLKQAVPAIGRFKESLSKVADDARDLAIQKAQDAEDATLQIRKANLAKLEDLAQQEIEVVKKAAEKVKAIRERELRAESPVSRLISADLTDMSAENMKAITADIKKTQASTKALQTKASTLESAGGDSAKILSLRAQASAQLKLVDAIKKSVAAEIELHLATESTNEAIKRSADLDIARAQASKINIAELEANVARESKAMQSALGTIAAARTSGIKAGTAAYRVATADLTKLSEDTSKALLADIKAAESHAKGLQTRARTLEKNSGDTGKVATLKEQAESQLLVTTAAKKALEARTSLASAQAELDAATVVQKQANLSKLEAIADKEVQAVSKAAKEMEALRDKGFRKNTATHRLLMADLVDLTSEGKKALEVDMLSAEASAKALETKAKSIEAAGGSTEKAALLRSQAEAQLSVVSAVRSSIEAEQALARATEEATRTSVTHRATLNAAEKARISSIKQSIVTEAAYNGSLIGVAGSYALLKESIAKSDLQLNAFNKTLLLARGSVAILAGAVSTLVVALGNVLAVVGILTAAFTLLDSLFSANAKEASEFKTSIDTADSASKTLLSTFDKLSRKDPLERLNATSLLAVATAVTEVAESTRRLSESYAAAEKAASGWDKFWDAVLPGSKRADYAKSMSTTVLAPLTKLASSKEAQSAKAEIAKILEIDPNATTATWEQAFNSIAANSGKTGAVYKELDKLGISLNVVASRASEMDNSLKASNDVLTELTDKFKAKDDVANFGASLVSASAKVAAAMQQPEQAIQKLYEVSSDVKKLSLFGTDDQANLLKYADKIKQVQESFSKQKTKTDLAASEFERVKMEEPSNQQGILRASANLAKQQQELAKESAKVQGIQAKFPMLAANQFARGAAYVETSISAALAKGANEFANAVLGAVGDLPGVAQQRANLATQQINAETSLLKAQYELIKTTRENTAIQAVRATQEEIASKRAESLSYTALGNVEKAAEAAAKATSLEPKLLEQQDVAKVYSMGGTKAALQEVRRGVAAGNKEMASQAEELLSYISSLSGLSSQIAQQADKVAGVQFKARVEKIAELASVDKKRLQDVAAELDLSKKQNQSRQQLGSMSEEDLVRRNAELDVAKEYNAATLQQVDLQAKIKTLRMAVDSKALSATSSKSATDEIERSLSGVKRLDKEASENAKAVLVKAERDLLDITLKRIQAEGVVAEARRASAEAVEDAILAEREAKLQAATDTELYTEKYTGYLNNELDLFKQAEEGKRKETQLTEAYKLRSAELLARWQTEMETSGWAGTQESSRLAEQIAAESTAYNAQVASINAITKAKMEGTSVTYAAKVAQDEFNSSIESLRGLDGIFDNLAGSIADVAESINSFAKSQKANLATVEALQKSYDAIGSGDVEGKAKAEKNLAEAKKLSISSEISGYGKIAGASKKVFKEKTVAYKTISALEKTSQAASLAIELETVAAKIAAWWSAIPAKAGAEAATTAAEAAGAAARAPITYGEIIGKYLATIPPPFGMVAGVAAGAFFLSLLGGGGSKSSSAPLAPNSEQKQETQGTGMRWQELSKEQSLTGEKVLVKVDTGTGVFGDANAKSQSILNAVEILRDNSVEGLSYDNKMLRALETVANSITGAAKAIYGVPGIRTGGNFGTLQGSSTESNWYQDIPIIGGALGSLFGGGTKVTASIESAGIALEGTFEDIIANTSSSILQYKNVLKQFEEDGGWFGSDDSWTERSRQTEALSSEISTAISDVFKQSKALFLQVAEQAGIAASSVENIFEKSLATEDIDLMGLKGEEVIAELNAVIGSKLDIAAAELFSSFDIYKNFGEGMLETVMRVTDTNTKISQAIENIGIVGASSLRGAYTLTESLVKVAGGLENFLDQASFFQDNFLDASARLLPFQKSVAKTFADLGMQIPKTRKEFALLVQGIDPLDSSMQQTYQTLMDVAPAFDTVADAADNALGTLKDGLSSSVSSLKSFIEQLVDFKAKLLLGSQSILTPLEKYTTAGAAFEKNYANIFSSNKEVAEKARSELTSSASEFLEASRSYYASSSVYTQDFNRVMQLVTEAEASTTARQTDAELQLKAIETSNSLLEQINENIKNLSLPELVKLASSGINITDLVGEWPTGSLQPAATGGWRQGITLVGEKGPEIVDFSSPGRVYTADQTAGMFTAPAAGLANQAVVQELKAVKAELVQLRKDQQQQTGDIIISNYDATKQSADNIAESISSTSSETAWRERTVVAIK